MNTINRIGQSPYLTAKSRVINLAKSVVKIVPLATLGFLTSCGNPDKPVFESPAAPSPSASTTTASPSPSPNLGTEPSASTATASPSPSPNLGTEPSASTNTSTTNCLKIQSSDYANTSNIHQTIDRKFYKLSNELPLYDYNSTTGDVTPLGQNVCAGSHLKMGRYQFVRVFFNNSDGKEVPGYIALSQGSLSQKSSNGRFEFFTTKSTTGDPTTNIRQVPWIVSNDPKSIIFKVSNDTKLKVDTSLPGLGQVILPRSKENQVNGIPITPGVSQVRVHN